MCGSSKIRPVTIGTIIVCSVLGAVYKQHVVAISPMAHHHGTFLRTVSAFFFSTGIDRSLIDLSGGQKAIHTYTPEELGRVLHTPRKDNDARAMWLDC